MTDLPAELLADSFLPARCGQPRRLGGVGGGTQGVSSHVSGGGGLAGGTSGSHGGRLAGDLPGGGVSLAGEAPSWPDPKLAPGEGSQPGDRLPRAIIAGGLEFEQAEHPLGAVRRPHGDGPSVILAQGLGGARPSPRRRRLHRSSSGADGFRQGRHLFNPGVDNMRLGP